MTKTMTMVHAVQRKLVMKMKMVIVMIRMVRVTLETRDENGIGGREDRQGEYGKHDKPNGQQRRR